MTAGCDVVLGTRGSGAGFTGDTDAQAATASIMSSILAGNHHRRSAAVFLLPDVMGRLFSWLLALMAHLAAAKHS